MIQIREDELKLFSENAEREKQFVERMGLRLYKLFGYPKFKELGVSLDSMMYMKNPRSDETEVEIYESDKNGFILFTKQDLEKLLQFSIGAVELIITDKQKLLILLHRFYDQVAEDQKVAEWNVRLAPIIGWQNNQREDEFNGLEISKFTKLGDPLFELFPIGRGFVLFTKRDIKELLQSNIEAVELLLRDYQELVVINRKAK